MIAERRRAWPNNASRLWPCSNRRAVESGMATPTIQMKKGKIKSVKVHPCHSAWSNGLYMALQVPGLLTSIIAAIVAPRNTSSDIKRAGPGVLSSVEAVPFMIYEALTLWADRPQRKEESEAKAALRGCIKLWIGPRAVPARSMHEQGEALGKPKRPATVGATASRDGSRSCACEGAHIVGWKSPSGR